MFDQDEFGSKGFCLIENAISRGEAAKMRDILADLIVEDLERFRDNPYFIDHHMVMNLMLRHQIFMDFLENKALLQALDQTLGEHSIIYAFTSSSLPARGQNYSNRIHHDCPQCFPGYVMKVGVIVALDEFTADNGATYFLPGSQSREAVPPEDEFFAKAERVYPRPGDMVVFNARIFHLGGQNQTQTDRHAITLNACRPFMRQRFDYPRMVSDEEVGKLSPVQRRLLGFNVRIPTSLDEYYVPPEKRLYLPGQD